MKLSDFDFDLPQQLVAQQPLKNRDESRLLVMDRHSGNLSDRIFSDVAELVSTGDLLVMNNTRVFPARLFGHKSSGGKVEVLVERILSNFQLLAHIKSSKSPKSGNELILEKEIRCKMIKREGDLFLLELSQVHFCGWLELLEKFGHVPLPPYIQRQDDRMDHQRYQTVYAKHAGAVAAPTAGLHFTTELLQKLQQKGVKQAYLTLHVGAGTFQPVRGENINEHVMHKEWASLSTETCELIEATKSAGKKVIAVGTTVTRCLEYAARSGSLKPFSGDTDLFIKPGFRFRVIDALITNFHLPKSTLLMLVSAFSSQENIKQAYQHAVANQYRFFSYGDAMLIL